MPAKILSAAVYGIDAYPVSVEADVQRGLPKVTVVGLPDSAVSEARDRIFSAIKNAEAEWPYQRITINLSPADQRKEGTGFDLPVAIAILVATRQIPDVFQNCLIVGELGLDATVRSTRGILSIAELARQKKVRLIVPAANYPEAELINEVQAIAVSTLTDIIRSPQKLFKVKVPFRKSVPNDESAPLRIWPSIRGQHQAKRAMTIAVAGRHNILLVGPPGSGKTMLAEAANELLPSLTNEEALEVTKIHSVAGLLKSSEGFIRRPPFRRPHHTSSVASLVGGGRIPRPGELSMAHHGILFLDEFPEFSRDHIEALRQPLEDGVVTVSRVAGSLQFPASGMLIAAMNPCPCGYRTDPSRPCRCSPNSLDRYRRRISGPVLDRFDVFVEVPRVPTHDLLQATIDDPRQRIQRSRRLQIDRQGVSNGRFRGGTAMLEREISKTSRQLLVSAAERLQLSARSVHRLVRVARTIADLQDSTTISPDHLAEALQYRPPALLNW